MNLIVIHTNVCLFISTLEKKKGKTRQVHGSSTNKAKQKRQRKKKKNIHLNDLSPDHNDTHLKSAVDGLLPTYLRWVQVQKVRKVGQGKMGREVQLTENFRRPS